MESVLPCEYPGHRLLRRQRHAGRKAGRVAPEGEYGTLLIFSRGLLGRGLAIWLYPVRLRF
jgi:hypothetical protein